MPGTVTEIHPQAEAFTRTLARSLKRGAAFFIDYGFPEAEYYHPQRRGGTLMCHQAHQADADPLVAVGDAAALGDAMLQTMSSPPDPGRLTRRAAEFTAERAVDRYLQVLLP